MNSKRFRLAILLPALAVFLSTCAPFGTSRKERVEMFEYDLNHCREYLYQNFLEAETDDYETIRDSDTTCTWDDWFPLPFPGGGTYTVTLDSRLGNPLEGTVDGPDGFEGPKSIQFHFARSGVYWYLEGLSLDESKIVD